MTWFFDSVSFHMLERKLGASLLLRDKNGLCASNLRWICNNSTYAVVAEMNG